VCNRIRSELQIHAQRAEDEAERFMTLMEESEQLAPIHLLSQEASCEDYVLELMTLQDQPGVVRFLEKRSLEQSFDHYRMIYADLYRTKIYYHLVARFIAPEVRMIFGEVLDPQYRTAMEEQLASSATFEERAHEAIVEMLEGSDHMTPDDVAFARMHVRTVKQAIDACEPGVFDRLERVYFLHSEPYLHQVIEDLRRAMTMVASMMQGKEENSVEPTIDYIFQQHGFTRPEMHFHRELSYPYYVSLLEGITSREELIDFCKVDFQEYFSHEEMTFDRLQRYLLVDMERVQIFLCTFYDKFAATLGEIKEALGGNTVLIDALLSGETSRGEPLAETLRQSSLDPSYLDSLATRLKKQRERLRTLS